jgi:AGZA family xanthine/uracil permease-like MFS transporter
MVADSAITPSLVNFSNVVPILATIGLIITIVLLILKVRGAILIGIIATTLIGAMPFFGVTSFANMKFDIIAPFKELPQTFFAAFDGIGTLFNSGSKVLISLMAIFAFSITDTFDTIGTFIGTGRRSGIFSDQDLQAIEEHSGFKTKMEKALFADSIATSVGALLGTSNTTTYVESSAGIEAGGKTGLTSVFTALFFFLCIFISPIVGIVPAAATAPALIVVGVMMLASFKEIAWDQLEEAVPAFFAGVLMALAYSISTGIALGFIFYIIVKICRQKAREIHPILWVSSALFVIYFIFMALIETNIVHI